MTGTVRMTSAWKTYLSHTQRLSGMAALGVFLILCQAVSALGQETTLLRVVEGKSIVLKYPEKIETVSLADDDVADVVAITADEVVIIGKVVGTTSLIVWGESQRHTAYEIKVDRSFSGLQILLEVQVGEINLSKVSELGFDFTWFDDEGGTIKDGQQTFGAFPGETQTPHIPLDPASSATGFFGYVGDHSEISASVRALQEQGDMKLLATPKLLSLSGETASFLSGGEIPVPVPQTGVGLATYTIEWKEYGVRLNFVPTVIDSNLINLRITPEVSSLDYANAITLSGFQIPAMLTRRADAAVELLSGQTLFLGGLMATEQAETIRRVPILGHIPLLGALFSRKDTSARKNELVIIVSPRIVQSVADEEVPPVPWDGKLEKDSPKADSVGVDSTGMR
jgi:Flp pilus assembly secretin CpaC